MKTITITPADLAEKSYSIIGNTSLDDAMQSVSSKKPRKLSIMDVYKAVPRDTWLGIIAACLNDTAESDTNKAARYWRASAKRHIKIAGVEPVLDFMLQNDKVHSFDTLARTYCPALYADARIKIGRSKA